MKQNNLAIRLKNVLKVYQLHCDKPTLIENIFSRNKLKKFIALNKINLEVNKGERVGIIGPNGSGKTTLLKIISGITTSNKGKLQIWGKLVSLIGLSAGFHPELTGRENIYQNALLLGVDREEIKNKLEDIIDFADIGDFINAPMYTYSDGMKLRLGFSIAVAADPDILILDEEIVVGDENFHKKSTKKINEIISTGKTVLIASHSIEYLKENCQRIVWIEGGKIRMDGGIEILDKYLESV